MLAGEALLICVPLKQRKIICFSDHYNMVSISISLHMHFIHQNTTAHGQRANPWEPEPPPHTYTDLVARS